ncbi:MAG: hypothetical protein IGR76_07210 [Synechococcales cyanobacterium T60_A2020_003]|nr:hypothetical protein [Synechococcales cyanobacterium T60_A2020_003]
MFLDELSPLFQEFTRQPVAFLGGLASGFLRLNLAEDPVKSWLDRQAGVSTTAPSSNNGKSSGPQSITID